MSTNRPDGSTPIERVLSKLPDAKKSGTGWIARCPGHDDASPSLSVTATNDGTVLIKCHAGCAAADVLAAVELKMTDLFPPKGSTTTGATRSERREVAHYDYTDAHGSLLYRVTRFDPKGFMQTAPNGNGGWYFSLNGIDRVLYKLPSILEYKGELPILYVEGEKDVERLRKEGFQATTHAGGVDGFTSQVAEAAREALDGKNVVIIPDNDDPGRGMADKVAKAICHAAASVKIVSLPGLKPKGDASDWFDAGNTGRRLFELIDAAPYYGTGGTGSGTDNTGGGSDRDKPKWPAPVKMSALPEADQSIEWIVQGLLAKKHLTLFSAIAKGGKTTLLALLYKALLTGKSFLGLPTKAAKILLVTEESATLWRKRRDALGLGDNLEVIIKPMRGKPSHSDWQAFILYVKECAVEMKADLIVFDTVGKVAPWKNENDAADVQESLNPLDHLTEAGFAVLLVHHMGKTDGNEGRAHRGSTALPGAADIVLELRRNDVATVTDRRRVMVGDGRFDETPREIVISLSDDGQEYVCEGNKRDAKLSELKPAILSALTDAFPGMTGEDVHDRIDNAPKVGELKPILRAGASAGYWLETGTGKSRDPYRFRLVPM